MMALWVTSKHIHLFAITTVFLFNYMPKDLWVYYVCVSVCVCACIYMCVCNAMRSLPLRGIKKQHPTSGLTVNFARTKT